MPKHLFILILSVFTYSVSFGQEYLNKYYRAEIALKKSDTLSAISIYDKIKEDHPNDFTSSLRLAEIYYQLKQFEDATSNASNAESILLKKKQKLSDANTAQDLKKNFTIDQDLASIYHLKGKIELKAQNWQTAEKNLVEAYQLYPDNEEVLIDLGIVKFHQSGVDSATWWFEKAIQQNSLSHLAYYNLAKIYLNDGRDSLGEQFLKKAIQIKRNFTPAYYSLAKLYLEQKNYDQASEYYQTLINLNEKSTLVYHNLAFALLNSGQSNEAIQYWQKALEKDSTDVTLLENLAITFLKTQNYKDATEITSRLIQLENSEYNLLLHAYALILNKESKAAISITKRFKNNPKARYYQSLAFLQLGKIKKACRMFKKSLKLGFEAENANEKLQSLCN